MFDEAFEAVQRAGMAFAAGERIDESLWQLMTAPWRRVMDGEQEIYPQPFQDVALDRGAVFARALQRYPRALRDLSALRRSGPPAGLIDLDRSSAASQTSPNSAGSNSPPTSRERA